MPLPEVARRLKMWEKWVVDITLWEPDTPDLLCFVPIEGDIKGECSFVFGMNLLTSPEGFNQGEIVAIIHEAGQEAVERWCVENPNLLKRLENRALHKGVKDVRDKG